MGIENSKIEEISLQLEKVIDPELGVDVVNLGLIYEIKVEGTDASIKMTLTTPGCPLHDTMTLGVKTAVEQLPYIKNCHVQLVWEPAWTPERINPLIRERFI